MSVVLMLLVGGAIQFYSVTLNVSDMDIRQVHLATSLMQMIEDDLRSTVHPQPIDTSALENLLLSTASQVGGSAPPSSDEDLSAAGITGDEAFDVSVDASMPDLLTDTSVLAVPGLIGNQFQIQVDVSRLPRLDEYMPVIDQTLSDLEDIPSDLKTVSYFVQPAGTIGGVTDSLSRLSASVQSAQTAEDESAAGGLVRRSLDRSATMEAINNGSIMTLNQTGELLAPEITAIEFSYWDGSLWLLEWNSDVVGQLPAAVKVQMTMLDPTATLTAESDPNDPANLRVISHIIRLPMSRPADTSVDEDPAMSEAGL